MEVNEHLNVVLETTSLEQAVESVHKEAFGKDIHEFRLLNADGNEVTPDGNPIFRAAPEVPIGFDHRGIINLIGALVIERSRETGEDSVFVPQSALVRRGSIELEACPDRYGYTLTYVPE